MLEEESSAEEEAPAPKPKPKSKKKRAEDDIIASEEEEEAPVVPQTRRGGGTQSMFLSQPFLNRLGDDEDDEFAPDESVSDYVSSDSGEDASNDSAFSEVGLNDLSFCWAIYPQR